MNVLVKIPSKQRSNAKKKMASYQERVRRGLRGMILKWCDSDPFSEDGKIYDTDVTHSNPIQKLIVKDMWLSCSEWILNTEFQWRVTMDIVYETVKRGDKIDSLEFDYTCTLRGAKSQILNDAMESELSESLKCNAAIADGHKNKGVYKHCVFKAQVVGV